MLIQFAGCCCDGCSLRFLIVNQVVLQEPGSAGCVAPEAVLLWWAAVTDQGQGLGAAQAEHTKWFVVFIGCLTCNLCLEVQTDYFSVLECYSPPEQGFSRDTNRECSSRELRHEFKFGLEKGVLWGQRWRIKWYDSHQLLLWVMREFRYQGTHKKWKGHFEGNILAPLLYSQNTRNQWCYIMTTKWEDEPSIAEVWWGHICSFLCEWQKRQFDTDLYNKS